MANMNIRNPVFYPDRIRHQRSRGSTIASIISGTGLIGFQSGSIGSLHNGKPLDLCSFDTSADTDGHILFNYDMGTSNWKTTFITILNHNLATAVGKVRIFFGASADAVNDVNGGSSATGLASVSPTQVINADTIAVGGNRSIHVAPDADGTTIIKIINNDMKTFKELLQDLSENVPANAMGAGGFNVSQAAQTGNPALAGYDPGMGMHRRKKKKVQ